MAVLFRSNTRKNSTSGLLRSQMLHSIALCITVPYSVAKVASCVFTIAATKYMEVLDEQNTCFHVGFREQDSNEVALLNNEHLYAFAPCVNPDRRLVILAEWLNLTHFLSIQ